MASTWGPAAPVSACSEDETRVSDFLVEEQFTRANNYKLGLLANKTKGDIYFEDNYNLLFDKLIDDNRFVIQQKSKKIASNLINNKWIMIVIVILLSIEWFIRKYLGKV